MILSEHTFKTSSFYVYDDDNKLISDIDHPYWEKHAGNRYELKALLENNTIVEQDSCIIIPIEVIYASHNAIFSGIGEDENDSILSPELLDFLCIPPQGTGILEIVSRGSFRSQNFNFICNYRLCDEKKTSLQVSASPVLKDLNGNQFLLSPEQNEVCQIIQEYEQKGPHDQENNFRTGSKLKRLCDLTDSIRITGGRLQKEHIEDIRNIRPRFHAASDGSIKLGIDLESGNNDEFEELVTSTPLYHEIFTSHGEGTERKRYILSDEAKKAINSFRQKSHFTREERRLLLEQPEKYLAGFNLDDYSDRVVGFGVLYAPKVSAFLNEDGTEWVNVDLLPLEPDTEGEKDELKSATNSFKFDREKAEVIKELIDSAEDRGSESIEIDGQEILITKELKNAVQKKIESESSFGLITKSNVDEITYTIGETQSIEPPKEFNISLPTIFSDQYRLKDFQSYGYGWLDWGYNSLLSGCLLADDMGMGKTIQICALLSKLKSLKILNTSLLIVPPILMSEWEKELGKFVPLISIYQIRSELSEFDINNLRQHDLLIITYQSHLRNQKILGRIPFKLIVCDEVQFIKNPASARTQAVLAMNGEYKIAATATPIENSISELWSILDFTNPGYLPPLKEFNKKYGERKISNEEFDSNIHSLKKKLSPIVLRRTKEEYLKNELKKKLIKTHLCNIDEKQVLLCRRIIHSYREEKTITNFLHFFQLIVMALTNPELMDGAYDVIFPTNYTSPKLKRTLELLSDIKEKNEKVLLFADRKRVQWKLKETIQDKFGLSAHIINGETPPTVRTKFTSPFRPDGDLLKEFNVLILSPKCAGFGLNLVQANHVIHYLRSFNPAIENQATDRVYRIGQEKQVFVNNLIASTDNSDLGYTVEQKLDEMIQRKQSLLKDYLYASRANRISEEDLAAEMNFENPGMSLADIDNLSPQEFEVFAAVLYSCQGYQSSLTPQHDFGADCIAIGKSGEANVLIQCKKKIKGSKSSVGNHAVQEIVAARKEYERQKQIQFESLVVITNGFYTDAARIQASSNNVILIGRRKLSELIKLYPVTQSSFNDYLKEHAEYSR
jgi:SNF2 family DNA or RNA helicase